MPGEGALNRNVIPFPAPAREHATELRLDYQDLAGGQLVIVVNGLPTAGEPHRASRSGSSSSPLLEEIEAASALSSPLLLAAWRGREVLTLELVEATIEDALVEDLEGAAALTEYAKAVLYNGLGRYGDALVAAQRACTREHLGPFRQALLELVEAAVRSGTGAAAAGALHHLEEQASAGTDRALGAWALAAALVSDRSTADTLYRESLDFFERGEAAVRLARGQLVYGEWLRRENRRSDARDQLRAAKATFSDLGAHAFAERARRELLATGEAARRRTDDARSSLTPQEAQIARLAGDGLSNPQIGAQLFISPRTVQYHLRKVFQKLDITSRNQLGRIPSSSLSTATSDSRRRLGGCECGRGRAILGQDKPTDRRTR